MAVSGLRSLLDYAGGNSTIVWTTLLIVFLVYLPPHLSPSALKNSMPH